MNNTVILGAGVTGLACGYSTGFTVFEMNSFSGGICSSYYLSHREQERKLIRRKDQNDYRFEFGGGHWIFGQNSAMVRFLSQFDMLKSYERKSSVYFKEMDTVVPYPIQNNLRYLSGNLVQTILQEVSDPSEMVPRTMYDWCESHFGPTLSSLFFHPFHELYTAGLWKTIQPQDGYKTPLDIKRMIKGAHTSNVAEGYNVSFVYPKNGLNAITSKLQEKCNIEFNKKVITIDIEKKVLHFEDGSKHQYDTLVTTLPLNVMQNITGLSSRFKQDPYTSVLVLNIGARKGSKEILDHWIYFPNSESGFHRVGFYSNVDVDFLPESKRNGNFLSCYVEKSYHGGQKPSPDEIEIFAASAIKELQNIGFIKEPEIVDSTWIDVAYTWSYPDAQWKQEILSALPNYDIFPVGRYATWKFQGILESINDGLQLGSMLSS